MTKLSVNVNKVATLRNARGGRTPDVCTLSQDVIRFGAQGITVHPRPDERHIRPADVAVLQETISALRTHGKDVEFNIEGYPNERFFELLRKYTPEQATLVPDAPDVLTSNAGWNIPAHKTQLQKHIHMLHKLGIRSSVFVEARPDAIRAAHDVGAQCVELYTGPYALAAEQGGTAITQSLKPYVQCAQLARTLNMGIHAGHDLCLQNIGPFIRAIPFTDEVSIGHALICESLYYGLQNVVGMYLERIDKAIHN